MAGGVTNTLTIGATATVAGGLYAIVASTGNDTVNNSGTVTGNVDLGGGVNAFNNLAGGTFNSGATVNLGAGNTLTNSGTLAPGGTGTVQTTVLTGNFVQNAGGKFAVDVDLAGHAADRLNVSGTAQLAGTVVVDPLARVAATTTYTIATAGTVNGTFLRCRLPHRHQLRPQRAAELCRQRYRAADARSRPAVAVAAGQRRRQSDQRRGGRSIMR